MSGLRSMWTTTRSADEDRRDLRSGAGGHADDAAVGADGGAAAGPGNSRNGQQCAERQAAAYPQQDDNAQNKKQESDTYGVSKKTRHTMEGAGKVRRMTAAVLINDRSAGRGGQAG